MHKVHVYVPNKDYIYCSFCHEIFRHDPIGAEEHVLDL